MVEVYSSSWKREEIKNSFVLKKNYSGCLLRCPICEKAMGLVICYSGVSPHVRLSVLTVRAVNPSESSLDSLTLKSGGSRLQVLQQVDELLRKGNEREALSLVKDLQGKPGGLRCFGATRQVVHLDMFSFVWCFFLEIVPGFLLINVHASHIILILCVGFWSVKPGQLSS